MSNKILITGGSGFVGKTLIDRVSNNQLVLIGRGENFNSNYPFFLADITPETDYSEALDGVSVVIHCAARVHVMNDPSDAPLMSFRKVNTLGTLNLAVQASAAGVKRFIFISTVKVNGEQTKLGKPFGPNDIPSPEDDYGVSKADAEEGLLKIGAETGMEIVIIRPPLVYGKGVKGNFASLLRLTLKRLPLPLGSIRNKRSLVSVQNLVDLIIRCIDHPNAANQIFLVSDGDDVSTPDLIRRLGIAANKPSRIIYFPVSLMCFIAKLTGKESAVERLTGSLQVDITHTKEALNWSPPLTLDEGLKSCFEAKDA